MQARNLRSQLKSFIKLARRKKKMEIEEWCIRERSVFCCGLWCGLCETSKSVGRVRETVETPPGKAARATLREEGVSVSLNKRE